MSAIVTGKLLILAVLAALAVLAPGAGDAAQAPPVSAVSQYVEQVPTGEGSALVGVDRTQRAELPAAAKKALASRPAAVSTQLTEIATSSAYGAPTARLSHTAPDLSKPRPVGNGKAPTQTSMAGDSSAERSSIRRSFRAVATDLGSGSDARLLGLVVFLLTTTVAMAAVAARERRGAPRD
jgi:hypothetical protein